MTTLQILAAGSLRAVWPDLMAAFSTQSNLTLKTNFGPAGMLRQRIERGEYCDLFASANSLHPEIMLQQGRALKVDFFAANTLCLTARRDIVTQHDNWLSLIQREDLRLATSTPVFDPSGDYTWLLFDNIERHHPGWGAMLKQKAHSLVGGPHSLTVPAGELAAQWLIDNRHADLFIGYSSYAPRLTSCANLQVFHIPASYNVQAEYRWACCSPAAQPFAAFLSSATARTILQRHGFQTVS